VLYFFDVDGHLQWTQKRLTIIFGHRLSMFIFFTVRHHTHSQEPNMSTYVVHDRSYEMFFTMSCNNTYASTNCPFDEAATGSILVTLKQSNQLANIIYAILF